MIEREGGRRGTGQIEDFSKEAETKRRKKKQFQNPNDGHLYLLVRARVTWFILTKRKKRKISKQTNKQKIDTDIL